MANKYVDVDIELEDAQEFIKRASQKDLIELSDAIKHRHRQLDTKPSKDLFALNQIITYPSRTPSDELACKTLQELLTRLGPEEILNRLNS